MFSGIVEDMGKIEKIEGSKYYLSCSFLDELKIGQSIAHDGVCLTVSNISNNPPKSPFDKGDLKESYEVELMPESIERTNFKQKKVGDYINLERSLKADGRFDGHIVQGHVDCTGNIESIEENENSWMFKISFTEEYSKYFVEKGSVTLNGISLTVIEANLKYLTVGIIPHTMKETNLQYLKTGDLVNIETDILAKYYVKLLFDSSPSRGG